MAPAIEKRILVVRGLEVMLDEDLADLYGVVTRVLVQQIKRNARRFPEDFHVPADKRRGARSETTLIPSCGHLAPLEAPEEFRRLVHEHLPPGR